jgi:phosphatidyl-myo-inositol dimannoside synthase
MNVLIVTPFYPPMVSGVGTYTRDVVLALIERGHTVTVLTCGDTHSVVNSDGVCVERASRRFHGSTSAWMIGRAIVRHGRRPFDVVLSSVVYPLGVTGCALGHLFGRPLVVLSHGEDVSAARESWIARRFVHHVLSSARRIVVNSNFTRGEVLHFGGAENRIMVVPPAIDAAPYLAVSKERRHDFRERFALAGRQVVLTVARLEPRKGHDTVLSAVHSLLPDFPDLHYLVVGAGDSTRLWTMAGELGISDRLTVIEYLPTAELAVAFASSDVFVMVSRPSHSAVEGFGIVYLEAGAAGLACVAGNMGGCADAVDDGVTGLCVDPTDAAAVAAALGKVLSSPEIAARMGAAGRRRVIADNDRRVLQARVSDILEAVGGG